MRLPRRGGPPLVTALAGVVAGVLMLAGCTGDDTPAADPSPAPSSSSAPARPVIADPPPAPRVRACYALSYDEAVAPTSEREPVPCRRPHTSLTFAVGTLDAVVDGHLLAVDSDRVQEQVASTCPDRLAGFVGGTVEQRRLSMLRAVWFTPTVEASDLGADWYRCDVIAVAAQEELARLTGPLAGVLTTEAGRDRYGMCGTAEPGTDGFQRVVCARQHSWRALRTVEFRAREYPGEARVRAAGESPCEDAGRAAADDALNFSWGYEWPTAEQWDAGQTYGICWAPD